ncbi:MAG: hypothetical protein ACI9W6_000154 [Motiliproteus sp.]
MSPTAYRLMAQTVALLTLAFPAWGAVQLTPSTDRGQVDQPFELQIEVSQYSSVIGAPELDPLQQDFNIHSNRSVYLTEKRDGRTLFISRWILSLSPKRAGTLIIPALSIKGEQSQPLRLQVQPKPRPKVEPLILKVHIDSADAYQGSPVSLSVKLYYSLNLQSAELTQPRIDGVRTEQLGDQLSYTESLDQQRYQVVEQRYLLQAQTPGRYRIPALYFNGTDGSGNSISSQSRPLEFEILPLPGNLSKQIQLVTSEVRLEQQWLRPLDNLRAGDTLTRVITLVAHGIPALWLPDIKLPVVEGVSAYPQPAQLQQSDINGVLVSRKTFKFKLLLTQPGLLRLPGVAISWWDTVRNEREIAELDPVDIQVQPFVAEASVPASTLSTQLLDGQSAAVVSTTTRSDLDPDSDAATDAATDATASPWQAWVWAAIALICAAGWSLSQQRNKRLDTELIALKQAPKPAPPLDPLVPNPSLQHNSFSALTEACTRNDPALAYRFLFTWAEANWPGMRVRTLEDIQELAKDPTLTYLLKNLEHQLQDPSDSWHGDLLIERLRRLRQQGRQPPSGRNSIRVAVED